MLSVSLMATSIVKGECLVLVSRLLKTHGVIVSCLWAFAINEMAKRRSLVDTS